MSVSTDGQICYGILLDEDAELPWKTEGYGYGIENWWIYGVHEFKHSVELYDNEGNHLNGVKPTGGTVRRLLSGKAKFLEGSPTPD